MSYSIGPFIGSRDALIQAVKMNVAGCTGPSKEEAQHAANFIIPLLEKLDPEVNSVLRAWGSASSYQVTGFIEVGQIGGGQFPVPSIVK